MWFLALSSCFLRAFFTALSTKSGVFMDRRQKFRVLSMKRALFVDKRDSVGLRKGFYSSLRLSDLVGYLDATDRVARSEFR